MNRPTFFISSTIYDFKDLRSSIKYYLEGQGCIVLASEFNDFQKSHDDHSYDACLSSIEKADYFILLIGSRVGGWYDEEAKISITQKEYQVAYELHKQGKLKILNFVRAEVWQAKDDRRELQKYLATLELDFITKEKITNYPAKTLGDAEFIINFLKEIGRSKETLIAVRGEGVAPTGNWIHNFSGIKDIMDVLSTEVISSVPIEDQAFSIMLKGELTEFLKQSLLKSETGVISPSNTIFKFHYETPITQKNLEERQTRMEYKRWRSISFLAIHLLAREFHAVVLPQVLVRPTYLEFDLESNSFKPTLVHSALSKLQYEIRKFNASAKPENLEVVFANSPARIGHPGEFINIDSTKLAGLIQAMDRWVNVIELSASLLKYLDGYEFFMPNLRPSSPIEGMAEMIEKEQPTDEDIQNFVRAYKPLTRQ